MDLYDALVAVGLVALVVGLSAYDWRLAAVVGGVILVVLGLAGVAVRMRSR